MIEDDIVMEKRIAVIGIAVSNRGENAEKVNEILSGFGEIIVGRMGIPYKGRALSVLSIIADGTNDEIGALAGKLGNIKGVRAKVTLVV